MKKLLYIIISWMLLLATNAQDDKKLIYKLTEFGIYVVTPSIGQAKSDRIPCSAEFTDENLANQLFYAVIKEVLSKDQLDSIKLGNLFLVDFNSKGEFVYCKFFINQDDRTLISEETLYKLYVRFRNLKIDMSKVELVGPYSSYKCDIGEFVGLLLPMEYRSKWLKR